jgi:hypothetical protein
VFNTGKNNKGYIALAPCLANDIPWIYYSNVGYDDTYPILSNSAPSLGNTVSGTAQLPYSAADLQALNNNERQTKPPDVAGRIVSCAIRIRYTGTNLNMGGTMVGYVDPLHGNLNETTYTGLASRGEALHLTVSRQWSELCVFANTPEEFSYPGFRSDSIAVHEDLRSLFPLSDMLSIDEADAGIGGVPLMFQIETAVAQQPFEFEVVQHVEYVGKLTTAYMTKSHTDVGAMGMIQEAANSMRLDRAGKPTRSAWRNFTRGLVSFYREHKRAVHTGIKVAAKAGAAAYGFSI